MSEIKETAGAVSEEEKQKRIDNLAKESITNWETAYALYCESIKLKRYKSALIFAACMDGLLPDAYLPAHCRISAQLAMGNYTGLEELFEEQKKVYGDNPYYINDRLSYIIKTGKIEDGIVYMQETEKLADVDSIIYLRCKARLMTESKNEEGMISCFERLFELYKDESSAFSLAMLYSTRDDKKSALEWIDRIISLGSKSVCFYMTLALRTVLNMEEKAQGSIEELKNTAAVLDAAANEITKGIALLPISKTLWEMAGETGNAEKVGKIIYKLKEFAGMADDDRV